MTVNLEYEMFIRGAFTKGLGQNIERWGDPAKLANTDVYSAGKLHEVKAAVSYSMLIFNDIIINEHSDHQVLADSRNYERLESIVEDVINASDKPAVMALIREYKTTFSPILS